MKKRKRVSSRQSLRHQSRHIIPGKALLSYLSQALIFLSVSDLLDGGADWVGVVLDEVMINDHMLYGERGPINMDVS